ncbi:NnrU family protein [Wenzhouxiangella sp. XN79A]|uniref:NnrU family protein n=1 Tax=Wenzhouxiangella sp. XN79A TaxID=2724193 RepID=UPI00144AE8C5|nr:NnrU family protein [Wenzhouxiangella sp. XN79A]NKI34945.1 NnrU family protein [Wenzhouxiangella sp. XN79A]
MTLLVLGLILFLGIHSISIVARPTRDRLAARLGEWPYKGLYSIVAAIGLVLIVIGYGQARLTPTVLYSPPEWLRHLNMLLMLIVFPGLLAAYLPGRIGDALKHPMLIAVKAWALSHLLVNGTLADVLLFGGFLAWAVADRISMNHRPAGGSALALPRTKFNDAIVVVGGLALYLAFAFWLHPAWIGVPVMGG